MSPASLRRAGLALVAALALAAFPATGALAAPRPAVAHIGAHGFPSVQAALDASHDGDTVIVSAGVFAGGIRITHSITLKGAGAGRTILRGGEHVVTVGTFQAPAGSEPHVSISGVTITGGVAHTNALGEEFFAEGGGVYVVPAEAGAGATLTLTDAVVTANRAEPAGQYVRGPLESDLSQVDWAWPICPDHQYCSFAAARGAGISTTGPLTLIRTAVTNNTVAGTLTSDAEGGGIASLAGGVLTVRDSHIDGNSAVAVAPFGRYAEGGGIFVEGDVAIALTRTTVNGNTTRLTTGFPVSYPDYPDEYQPVFTDTLANAAGIHVGEGGSLALSASHVDRNALVAHAPNGGSGGYNVAIQTSGAVGFSMTDSTADDNSAEVTMRDGRSFGASGGAVQWDAAGPVARSSISRNTSTVTASNGLAWVSAAALAAASSTIRDTSISANRVTVRSPHGGGVIAGVGLITDTSETLLIRTRVIGNVGTAKVADGAATQLLGGGISNGADQIGPGYSNPDAALTLTDSVVTGNTLTSSARRSTITGAGIHSLSPVTLTRSTVRGNAPDDCDACTGSTPGRGSGHHEPPRHWRGPEREWQLPHHLG